MTLWVRIPYDMSPPSHILWQEALLSWRYNALGIEEQDFAYSLHPTITVYL